MKQALCTLLVAALIGAWFSGCTPDVPEKQMVDPVVNVQDAAEKSLTPEQREQLTRAEQLAKILVETTLETKNGFSQGQGIHNRVCSVKDYMTADDFQILHFLVALAYQAQSETTEANLFYNELFTREGERAVLQIEDAHKILFQTFGLEEFPPCILDEKSEVTDGTQPLTLETWMEPNTTYICKEPTAQFSDAQHSKIVVKYDLVFPENVDRATVIPAFMEFTLHEGEEGPFLRFEKAGPIQAQQPFTTVQ